MSKYTYISEAGDSVVERHYDSARAPSKIMHDGRPHWIALLYGTPVNQDLKGKKGVRPKRVEHGVGA